MSVFLPRNWTIRVRLTVLYGGLFFLAGAILLAVTYLLLKQTLDGRTTRIPDNVDVGQLRELLPRSIDPEALRRVMDQFSQAQEEFRAETLDSLLTQGVIALGLLGVVAVGFGWLVAARALRPLHRVTETARRIGAVGLAGRGLHERIALTGPRDEIRELADTFDQMIDRLDRSFDGQRRLVASASHELRTPLAINRALIELAVTAPDASPDVRKLGDSLLTINGRHERLIDGLLTLADSENGLTEESSVDLAEVARHVSSVSAPAAAEAGVEIRTDLAPGPVRGDPVLLERLTHNLVENAVRHNRRGGWLSVTTRSGPDGRAELVIANTGPVVQGYQVETIFQPFRRLSGERASPGRGFGLGLSIVAAVARTHGGVVSAVPRAGGGLVVTVTLPLSPG